jgi:hypothetical protein
MVAANGPRQQQQTRCPVEPPNGGYAIWSTDRGAAAMVREDDPAQPTRPDRWRKLDGTSRWYTWDELARTGTIQRLYTAGQLGATQVPHYHHLPADPNPRLPAGDRRLLTAIGDGRVVVADDTRRDAPPDSRGLLLGGDGVRVAAAAATNTWRRRAAGLTGNLVARLARLYAAGLIAEPVYIGPVPARPAPYLLSPAGRRAVVQSRGYRGQPLPMTLRQPAAGVPTELDQITATTGPVPPGTTRPTAGSVPHAAAPSDLTPAVTRAPARHAVRPAPGSTAAATGPLTRAPGWQPPTPHSNTRGRA